MILTILNTIWWSFLRAWYGGQYKNTVLGNHRGLQTTVMLLSLLPLFIADFDDLVSIATGIVLSLWVQFQFWSRGHGPAFDIGNDKDPSEGTVKRYAERWYNKVCQWMLPKEYWYTRTYDIVWMFLRYTCPMLPLAFINPLYLLCGIPVPFIYDCIWKRYGDWHPAEYIVGALFGAITGAIAYV